MDQMLLGAIVGASIALCLSMTFFFCYMHHYNKDYDGCIDIAEDGKFLFKIYRCPKKGKKYLKVQIIDHEQDSLEKPIP